MSDTKDKQAANSSSSSNSSDPPSTNPANPTDSAGYQFFTPNLNYNFLVDTGSSPTSGGATDFLAQYLPSPGLGELPTVETPSFYSSYASPSSTPTSNPSTNAPVTVAGSIPVSSPSLEAMPSSSPLPSPPPLPSASIAPSSVVENSPAPILKALIRPVPSSKVRTETATPPASVKSTANEWLVSEKADEEDHIYHPIQTDDAFEDRYKQRSTDAQQQILEQQRLLEAQQQEEFERQRRIEAIAEQERAQQQLEQAKRTLEIQRRQEREEEERNQQQSSCQDHPIESTPVQSQKQSFDLEASLMRIFWRVDINRNNKVNAAELTYAIKNHWFSGLEDELARAILQCYGSIAPCTTRDDEGLTVEQILQYPPFVEVMRMQGNSDSGRRSPLAHGIGDPSAKLSHIAHDEEKANQRTTLSFKKSRHLT